MGYVATCKEFVLGCAWDILCTTYVERCAIAFPSDVNFDLAASLQRGRVQDCLIDNMLFMISQSFISKWVMAPDGKKIDWGKWFVVTGVRTILTRIIKRQYSAIHLSPREEGVLFIFNMARVFLLMQLTLHVPRFATVVQLLVGPWRLAWNSMETTSAVVSLAWFQTVASHPKKAFLLCVNCFALEAFRNWVV